MRLLNDEEVTFYFSSPAFTRSEGATNERKRWHGRCCKMKSENSVVRFIETVVYTQQKNLVSSFCFKNFALNVTV